ncbi:MAG: metalloregulator ArsR/SmtB family transcription factor [Pseudomonadota bacterium]
MEQSDAIEALAALAQESRLEIFRLLVREEPGGLPVSEISRRLNIVPSTLSGHLALLRRAKLLRSERNKREIIYSADFDGFAALMSFLLEDCCGGRVDSCDDLVSSIRQVRAEA